MSEFRIKKFWHELYVLKESDPFDQREDKTFCEENNINYDTFRNWKSAHRREIYEEVNRRREEYKTELRAKARKALAKKLDKDTNAIKLAFQVLGDLVEKQEIKAEHYTQEALKRRINDLLQNISDRTQTWKDEPTVETAPKDHKESDSISNGNSKPEPGKDTPDVGEIQSPINGESQDRKV